MPEEKAAKERWLDIVERTLPLLLSLAVPVAGGLWAVYLYTQNQSDLAAKRNRDLADQTRARVIELQKPFIDQQSATYNDLIRVIGDLLSPRAASENWIDSEKAYRHLHFGRLALVEDQEIHSAKAAFLGVLLKYRDKGAEEDLKFSKQLENASKLRTAEEQLHGESLEIEKAKLAAESSEIDEELRKVRVEIADLHTALEKASVPLTAALRRSIQKSWTGDLGK